MGKPAQLSCKRNSTIGGTTQVDNRWNYLHFAPWNDRYLRQAAVADRGAERSHSAGAGTGFGLRPALAVADEPRRNGGCYWLSARVPALRRSEVRIPSAPPGSRREQRRFPQFLNHPTL